MRTKHWLSIIVVIILILAALHYFTKHNGQSVAGSLIPGVHG